MSERAAILGLLRAYRPTITDPHEREMADRMVAFVEAEPTCLWRHCRPGHLTGSAWIVDRERRHVLLTHHRKLDRWLQLGGHADGDPDLRAVALREAREESGLASVRVVADAILDVDCHTIPARGADPEHVHYDVRFLIEADRGEPLVISAESKDLAWVALERLADLHPEPSLLRMAAKTAGQR